MTEHVREWLPHGAFTRDTIQPALSALLVEWSRRWFPEACAEVAGIQPGKVKVSQPLIVKSEFTEAEIAGRGKRLLLESILGVDLSGVTISDGDRILLDALASEAVTDLLASIDKLRSEKQGGEQLTVTLALGDGEMAFLFLTADMLVPAIKASMGRQRRILNAPRSRIEALKPTQLSVVAKLGKVDVGLGDLRNLSVGDVVVLDKSVQEPAELCLSGGNRPFADGRLGRDGSRVTIQF